MTMTTFEREPERSRFVKTAHVLRTGTHEDCLAVLGEWFETNGRVYVELAESMTKEKCVELGDDLLPRNPETSFLLYAISYLLEERAEREAQGQFRG